ncbi:DUF1758 domain-containing protein [Trichonephila inaurata madagascariensis]|uniref:DUF1758 domain-containing protein n=1 Tax=Trichonephila inaurata madagascariensis TaxID=2747483 RepID=A0A8X6YAR1_9ARAC|nr:DUF1758 domain-containing protein [Trichonephila inaurata madagascariensis]
MRAMYDSGSQKSYIRKEMASALGLAPLFKQHLSHALFGGERIKEKVHNVHKIELGSLDGSLVVVNIILKYSLDFVMPANFYAAAHFVHVKYSEVLLICKSFGCQNRKVLQLKSLFPRLELLAAAGQVNYADLL